MSQNKIACEDQPAHLDNAVLPAILRQDFSAFVEKCFHTLCPGDEYRHNWHIDYLCYELSPILSNQSVRLVVNMPPRSLKSLIVSVALPAWLLGHDPTMRVIVASYSDDLSRKHARDFRAVVESKWYRNAFPRMHVGRKNTESELTTTAQGFRLATSIDGTLTGRGGDVIIVDDPIKPADAASEVARTRVNEWFESTLLSRLDDKEKGNILIVMQRLHEDDLAGHVFAKGLYKQISLPAIAVEAQEFDIGPGNVYRRKAGEALHPERESVETLIRVKAGVGSHIFAAQYQQSPVPKEGNLIRRDWLRPYKQLPALKDFDRIVVSWDTAHKVGHGNDYSVGTVWGVKSRHSYLIDVCRGRWEFPDLLRQESNVSTEYRPNVILIEDANSGTALIQTLQQKGYRTVIPIKAKLDKVIRASQQCPQIEAGNLMLPEIAPWLADFESELLAFPNGKFDDQVDSTMQFLQWAAEQAARPKLIIVPPAGEVRESPWKL